MSNLNQSTQSKPLGSGVKAGTTSENRILYVLLFVLIAAFFWKVASDDNRTKTIAQDKHLPSIQYEEVTSTANPNVNVEIMDVDLLIAAEVNATKEEPKKSKKADIAEESKINPDFYKSYNLKQMPITKVDGFDNMPVYDYNYIFAGDINVPEGTFVGIDDEGYAILMEKKKRALIGAGIIAQTQTILQDEFYPKSGNVINENIHFSTNRAKEYPSTGVSYGNETYPLDDTLGWHPYESLAYLKDKKEVYVAKKVRKMPTLGDLERYIPPSTLGDKDTRMGYGVVIRPKK